MMTHSRWLIVGLVGLLLTGCIAPQLQPQSQPEPVVVAPPPEPVNREVLQALSELSEIKQELKELRGAVEELEFEADIVKRRQQNLYQDIDRRLVLIERHQSATASLAAGGDQVGIGQPAVVPGGDILPLTPGEQTAPVDSVDQVTVVSPSPALPATTDQGEPPATVATDPVTPTTPGAVTLEQQEAYKQAFELLKQSRYEEAVAGFQQFIDTWPANQIAGDALYWMSEARYVNREFEHALNGFRAVVSRYPDSRRVPEAMLKVGYIQYDIGSYDDAAATLREVIAQFPSHPAAVSAQTRLRRIEQTIQ